MDHPPIRKDLPASIQYMCGQHTVHVWPAYSTCVASIQCMCGQCTVHVYWKVWLLISGPCRLSGFSHLVLTGWSIHISADTEMMLQNIIYSTWVNKMLLSWVSCADSGQEALLAGYVLKLHFFSTCSKQSNLLHVNTCTSAWVLSQHCMHICNLPVTFQTLRCWVDRELNCLVNLFHML